MSEPLTPNEKQYAQNDHHMKQQYQKSQQELQKELLQKNMTKYDVVFVCMLMLTIKQLLPYL